MYVVSEESFNALANLNKRRREPSNDSTSSAPETSERGDDDGQQQQQQQKEEEEEEDEEKMDAPLKTYHQVIHRLPPILSSIVDGVPTVQRPNATFMLNHLQKYNEKHPHTFMIDDNHNIYVNGKHLRKSNVIDLFTAVLKRPAPNASISSLEHKLLNVPGMQNFLKCLAISNIPTVLFKSPAVVELINEMKRW